MTLGFSVAGTPLNLLLCFIGVFLGTLIGVLPGIGPMTGVALLIPLTFSLKPNSAIILMAGIYYGAMYGGSTTSILVNTPGESSSVVTCLDGYQMAKKGRAGQALAAAAIGSFIAGTFATLMLMLFGPWVAGIALQLRPAGVLLPDGGGAHGRDEPGGPLAGQGAALRRSSAWRSPRSASTTRAGCPASSSTIPS